MSIDDILGQDFDILDYPLEDLYADDDIVATASQANVLSGQASVDGNESSEGEGDDDRSGSERNGARKGKQARRWCITLNNPTDQEKELFANVFEENLNFVRYFVYQLEQGESGTPHFQGYVEFSRQARWKRVKKLFGDRVHVESARGDFESNEKYCSKDDGRLEGPWRFGTPAKHKQGQRNDLLAVKKMIDDGKSMKHIWNESFEVCVKFHRGFDAYRLVRSENRDFKTEVLVCYGPSGTGKSHYAHTNHPGAYWKQRGNWFDNYNDHEVVVIDEFYGWLPFDTLLRLCDKYPMMVEIKGGQVNFRPKILIITSNQRPDEWYKNVPNMAALIRRIDKLYYFPTYMEPHMEFENYDEFKEYVTPNFVENFNQNV